MGLCRCRFPRRVTLSVESTLIASSTRFTQRSWRSNATSALLFTSNLLQNILLELTTQQFTAINMDPEALIRGREELLNHQKALFNTAVDRKGQRAQNRPTRHELEVSFSLAQAAAGTSPNGMHAVRQTVVGYSYPPCATPLADLTPITMDELRLEENHIGRVLFARTFGTPRRIQAVQGAIFDTSGDVDRIAVYNFETGLAPNVVLPLRSNNRPSSLHTCVRGFVQAPELHRCRWE